MNQPQGVHDRFFSKRTSLSIQELPLHRTHSRDPEILCIPSRRLSLRENDSGRRPACSCQLPLTLPASRGFSFAFTFLCSWCGNYARFIRWIGEARSLTGRFNISNSPTSLLASFGLYDHLDRSPAGYDPSVSSATPEDIQQISTSKFGCETTTPASFVDFPYTHVPDVMRPDSKHVVVSFPAKYTAPHHLD